MFISLLFTNSAVNRSIINVILIKMAKQENLIKKIKSNLCGVFQCRTENYEYISYDNKEEIEVARCDNFDKILPSNLQTKSRSRVPIYCNTPFVTIRRKKEETKFEEDFEFQQQITINNHLHSTKLHENIQTPIIPSIPVTPPPSINKASSTMMFRIPKSQTNEFVSTPNSISNIRMYQESDQSLLTTSSDDYESSTISSSASSEISFKYQLFKAGSIFVCLRAYKSKHDGDLTINYAERLKIIIDDGNEFILVKRLSRLKYGYVPRNYIIPVDQFLLSLKP